MDGIQAVIGLTGFETEAGGVRLSAERFLRLQLPSTITAEHIELMQKDLEVLASLARDYPEKMAALQNAVSKNDFGTAQRLADDIGMNEANMARSGGGQIGVAVAIVAVLVVVAVVAGGGGEASPEPVGPNPEEGSSDGGSDAGIPGGI